jgi:hypothetical protein
VSFLQIAWYCTCGKSFKAELRRGPVLDQAREAWAQLHTGPGHEPDRDAYNAAMDSSIEELRQLIEEATASEPPL